jgi:hypothetical protein
VVRVRGAGDAGPAALSVTEPGRPRVDDPAGRPPRSWRTACAAPGDQARRAGRRPARGWRTLAGASPGARSIRTALIRKSRLLSRASGLGHPGCPSAGTAFEQADQMDCGAVAGLAGGCAGPGRAAGRRPASMRPLATSMSATRSCASTSSGRSAASLRARAGRRLDPAEQLDLGQRAWHRVARGWPPAPSRRLPRRRPGRRGPWPPWPRRTRGSRERVGRGRPGRRDSPAAVRGAVGRRRGPCRADATAPISRLIQSRTWASGKRGRGKAVHRLAADNPPSPSGCSAPGTRRRSAGWRRCRPWPAPRPRPPRAASFSQDGPEAACTGRTTRPTGRVITGTVSDRSRTSVLEGSRR